MADSNYPSRSLVVVGRVNFCPLFSFFYFICTYIPCSSFCCIVKTVTELEINPFRTRPHFTMASRTIFRPSTIASTTREATRVAPRRIAGKRFNSSQSSKSSSDPAKSRITPITLGVFALGGFLVGTGLTQRQNAVKKCEVKLVEYNDEKKFHTPRYAEREDMEKVRLPYALET